MPQGTLGTEPSDNHGDIQTKRAKCLELIMKVGGEREREGGREGGRRKRRKGKEDNDLHVHVWSIF